MKQFDIVEFTAEIDSLRYRVRARGCLVSPIKSASHYVAKNLAEEYKSIKAEMSSDPGLRHCDSGYAFASELKKRYKAKIWDIKMKFYPEDAVF